MSSLEKTMDSEHAKIHAISSVIVAIIVAFGVIIAAVVVAGGDYGRGPIPCMTTNGGGALKAMPNSVAMDIMIVHDEAEIGMQRARYDYDKNTILVETPAISDGFNNATIVIDYDRSVVFIKLLDADICYVSALSGDMMDMADRSTNFMETGHMGHEQAIDVKTATDVEMNYQTAGLIPAGYVTNSNGPIIRALCAGDESHWTIPRMTPSRKRRRSGLASARFCIFGFCFNINF